VAGCCLLLLLSQPVACHGQHSNLHASCNSLTLSALLEEALAAMLPCSLEQRCCLCPNRCLHCSPCRRSWSQICKRCGAGKTRHKQFRRCMSELSSSAMALSGSAAQLDRLRWMVECQSLRMLRHKGSICMMHLLPCNRIIPCCTLINAKKCAANNCAYFCEGNGSVQAAYHAQQLFDLNCTVLS